MAQQPIMMNTDRKCGDCGAGPLTAAADIAKVVPLEFVIKESAVVFCVKCHGKQKKYNADTLGIDSRITTFYLMYPTDNHAMWVLQIIAKNIKDKKELQDNLNQLDALTLCDN